MSREIKFRAWDTEKGEMLPDVDCDFDSLRSYVVSSKYEVMQYTGLKDKNGKEVYEGDIVKHRLMDRAGDLASYGIGMSLEANKPIVVQWAHCGFLPFSGWVDKAITDIEYEVIGNIWENGDLLK